VSKSGRLWQDDVAGDRVRQGAQAQRSLERITWTSSERACTIAHQDAASDAPVRLPPGHAKTCPRPASRHLRTLIRRPFPILRMEIDRDHVEMASAPARHYCETRTMRLPRFSPASRPINAFGVFSRPSITSS